MSNPLVDKLRLFADFRLTWYSIRGLSLNSIFGLASHVKRSMSNHCGSLRLENLLTQGRGKLDMTNDNPYI